MSNARKKAPAPDTNAKQDAPRAPASGERRAGARDARLLDPVLAALRKRVGKAAGDDASAFAAAFYQRMGEDEIAMHEADGWAALAADFLGFLGKRKPGVASVRLFNPTLASHGWETQHTVLQIANDDMPFLVDSVTMALAELGVGVHVLGHPVVKLGRDRAGKLQGVGEGAPESLIHMEIDRQAPDGCARIEAALRGVLEDVRSIVDDWAAMRTRMELVADGLADAPLPVSDEERAEIRAFLRWAADNHFTFFGYREYEVVRKGRDDVLQAIDGTGLGLLRGRDVGKPRLLSTVGAQRSERTVEPLILTKTNARSTIHRPGYMDYIGVLGFDGKSGKATTEKRFLGLYTSSAYNRRPWDIPIVRQRHEQVMGASGLADTGHSGKALKHILESLPRDELFQASSGELQRVASGILGLQERVRSRLFLRRDHYGRFYSVLAYVPRDRYNTEVRLRVEALLKDALGADHVDANVTLGESPLAQLHMLVRPRTGEAVDVDEAALQDGLAAIVRNWQDDLRETLIGAQGEARGLALASGWARALPVQYIERATPEGAAADVVHLDALAGPDDLRLSLQRAMRAQPGEGPLRLKLYRADHDVPLSDVLPMMENMGLRVIAEHPHRLEGRPVGADAPRVAWIQDFEVEVVGGAEPDAAKFEEAFVSIWRGDAENDGFNRLVAVAGLEWRQVAVLRGYCKYLLQVGVPFSQSYVEATLVRYPALARLLVALFEARFDPAADKGRAAAMDAARAAIRDMLEDVASLDEDRILRSYVGVIDATLRTSYYQLGADGAAKDYMAFKFDSAAVPDLPKPRPYREIFVYGPHVEGTHLRFGPVARGGLRWSDRREDFRTEVLGLVKAQMVKNTVIVPVGSKGGFIVKRPPVGGDRDAMQAEGIACYRRFISGLLDVTDNLTVDGKVIPPANVVRHDDPDPYMVVAADKGTATFSDIANGISRDYGYWLDDAFASGGSVGYDHKGMGITARGAWESVKRHFRALGHDSQKQDFTVAGIGDMSGDVFGNGMLLSKHIRLVAAMDHRHIFVDPNPDSASSYKERQRLFKVPRSSWDDYDKGLISQGGGVFARSLKSIPVSPEMRAALGLDAAVTAMTPNELMAAVLKAPVDLLWNGGIGTYVKGAAETHADVGDRANNAIRVNGGELRCRVVGEGGNLGMTQRGRIEAALAGVLLNTDFIDNSAGVDTSDHEVNIKILLNAQVQAGKLKLADRNSLLKAMTDEVAGLVLHDNYRQNQALSLMERMSVPRLGSKQHFIRTLESQGLLDRQIEFLPSDAEIAERKARNQGFTRPELAILLSYSKLVAFEQLLNSDIPEDPYLSRELQRYFPQPLQAKYAKAMEQHRLKREIIATAVTNSTINRMGATFLLRMQEDSGRTPAEVAKAFTVTRETLEARTLWAQIDALDGKVAESVQIDALQVIWSLQRSFTRWLLARPGALPTITSAVERYHDGFQAIRAGEDILTAAQRPAYEQSLADWRAKGVPAELAGQLAALPYLEASPDIIELSRERKRKPAEVARVHFRLADALNLPWLVAQIDALAVDGRWHAVAHGALRDELAAQHRALVGQVLSMPARDADAKVAQWLARDDAALKFTLAMLAELAAQKTLDYPTASVAVRRLAQLASAG
ncbi:NAD-glutamate dehydrogenase [Luteimonas sp. MC1782]|uniref:NAD-glutamate dehydrogenase n=1 Tax=Luteimonas sp. MC1782 TaxID=2760305 RepID=UPI0015FF196F|nr:NAD-glutamate dehydrogenase domain-containing protein [Luteimonas sp. MC1782]MBB1471901.1 NAD-glutamate dehydrogenase [Luteimonas sp. MC1782]